MKLIKISSLILVLVVDSQCGVIDNIYDGVKNTTIGIKQDVTNAVSFGKRIIGLEKESERTEQKPGFFGGIIQSTRERLHSVHEYFWGSDELSEDRGLFGNMYNRVKNRLSKIKGALTGVDEKGQITYTETENAKLVRETMNKLFFNNGTRRVHGKAFQAAIDNLRKKILDIRHNVTNSATNNPINHGEGLIDVRRVPVNVNKVADSTNSVANNIYDKVDDKIDKVANEATESINNAKRSVDKRVHVVKDDINSGLEKLADAAAKEKDLLDSGYKKLNEGVTNVESKVKAVVDDMNPIAYN